MKQKLAIIFSFITVMFVGCERSSLMNEKTAVFDELNSISSQSFDKLSKMKIYFGHQSVGYNIIDGVNDIIKELPGINLNVKETTESINFDDSVFAHSKVGKNRNPQLKCDGFERNIENGIGNKVDIAFFKYCYLDIEEDTDIDIILQAYIKTITNLEEKYPNIKFIYVTIPLTESERPLSFKAIVKKILGYEYLWDEKNNIKRTRFNQALRSYCGNNKILFDLEKFESTYPDGKPNIYRRGGVEYRSLIPKYTDDRGHLNSVGRKIIAKELLKLLVSNVQNIQYSNRH